MERNKCILFKACDTEKKIDGAFELLTMETSDIPSLNELYDLLECECIDIIRRKIGYLTCHIIVDDNGKIRPDQKNITGICTNYDEKLQGNIMICSGIVRDGELFCLTDEEVEDIKRFIAYIKYPYSDVHSNLLMYCV